MLADTFVEASHGDLDCYDCHEGSETHEDKAGSHTGMVGDPSDAPAASNNCAPCHTTQTTPYEDSLHYTQNGYFTTFEARSGVSAASSTGFQQAFTNHCAGCHASCGQCHISRPASVGGGLIDEHTFMSTPSQNDQCVACHGSRINDEYKGLHEGLRPDVHYLNGMTCLSCHSGAELHGDGTTPDDRRGAANAPSCAGCHSTAAAGTDGVAYHSMHATKVDCPVCHSQPYRNCYQCHVGTGNGKTHGIQFPSELDFRIGLNPIQSTARPWDYVVLRHIPVEPEMYDVYGVTLTDYASLPTWKYATPHNIRRNTPQTASCANCHDERGVYLTSAYLDSLVTRGVGLSDEIAANAAVVTDPPVLPGQNAQGGKR